MAKIIYTSNRDWNETLKEIIKDNPAGQEREQTPLVLIKKKNNYGKP